MQEKVAYKILRLEYLICAKHEPSPFVVQANDATSVNKTACDQKDVEIGLFGPHGSSLEMIVSRLLTVS